MEYVFDPRVYGGTFLRNRCMGSQLDSIPLEGQEAYLHLFDIDKAFYKTADNHWCLGL